MKFLPYVGALAVIVAVTALGKWVLPTYDPSAIAVIYVLSVVVSGLLWGQGPAVLAAVGSIAAFDYFFVPPTGTLAIGRQSFLLTSVALFLVALAVGNVTGRLADHVRALREREAETLALYEFTRSLAPARGITEISKTALRQIEYSFHVRGSIALLDVGRPGFHLVVLGEPLSPEAEAHCLALLRGEESPPPPPAEEEVRTLYFPLETADHRFGVLVLPWKGPGPKPVERRLLEAFASQIAVLLERAQLHEAAREAQMEEERDKLREALFHSISRSLRTPLASIQSRLTALLQEGDLLSPETRQALEETLEEVQHLSWLVHNLLDMTRLRAGRLHLNVDWHEPRALVGAALEEARLLLKGRPLEVNIPEDLPALPTDLVLLVHAMVNLLQNAVEYSPAGSPIHIEAWRENGGVAFAITDEGPGAPEDQLPHLFKEFFRGTSREPSLGVGLGLAIAKGIVEAHGGRIWAENAPGKGLRITFTLPTRSRTMDDWV
ncbi:MAG: DUF4118 domain-containing protein [Clostridiales bacterium]|nr:DUF4118 domain-containing protein [Clostridiales bacterium]